MKKLTITMLIIASLCACNNENSNTEKGDSKEQAMMDNTLTGQEKADGWQLLFDGNTLNGWHKYGNEAVGSSWKIADGVIMLDGADTSNGKINGGGDIVTDEDFGNFDLKLDWKISVNGNSGIIFYVNEDTSKYKWSYESGPEMQVLDNNGHPDAKIPKHRAGDLYDLISCSKETVKPAMEWNSVEIRSLNGKLDFWLNGENVVSTTMWDDNWRTMIANSKFKEWEGFGTFQTGKICLQEHESTVWFKNIRIKKL